MNLVACFEVTSLAVLSIEDLRGLSALGIYLSNTLYLLHISHPRKAVGGKYIRSCDQHVKFSITRLTLPSRFIRSVYR